MQEVPAQLGAAVSEAELVDAARRRARSTVGIPRRDLWSGRLTGASFVAAMALWWLLAPPAAAPLLVVAACVVAHALASRVEFEIGPGSALPTSPILLLSAYLLPAPTVPLVAAAGLIVSAVVARLRDPDRRERLDVLLGSAWHALGPALAFAVLGDEVNAWARAAVALVAQFALDSGAAWVRNCIGLGVPARRLFAALRFTFLVDLLLAPMAVLAALAKPGSEWELIPLFGPIVLLSVLQRDRIRQLDRVVALGQAFAASSEGARTDVLTGLRNRLAWEEALASVTARPEAVGVVLGDVDGLKLANDTLGHAAGDELLAAVAQCFATAAAAHSGAVAARLGGDEFGVLLPGASPAVTAEIEDLLRTAMASQPPVRGVANVRASLGAASSSDGSDVLVAIDTADQRVNLSKLESGTRRSSAQVFDVADIENEHCFGLARRVGGEVDAVE